MPGYWEALENSPYWNDGNVDNGEVVAQWFVKYGPELLRKSPIKNVPTALRGLAEDPSLLPELSLDDPRIQKLEKAPIWPYPIYAQRGATYRLLDGNHRRALMEFWGYSTMPAVVLSMELIFDSIKAFFRG